MSGRMSDRVLIRVSDRVSERVSDRVSDRMLERMSDSMSDRVSDRVSHRVSNRVSNGCRMALIHHCREECHVWVRDLNLHRLCEVIRQSDQPQALIMHSAKHCTDRKSVRYLSDPCRIGVRSMSDRCQISFGSHLSVSEKGSR